MAARKNIRSLESYLQQVDCYCSMANTSLLPWLSIPEYHHELGAAAIHSSWNSAGRVYNDST